jgi:hypothetical protein
MVPLECLQDPFLVAFPLESADPFHRQNGALEAVQNDVVDRPSDDVAV